MSWFRFHPQISEVCADGQQLWNFGGIIWGKAGYNENVRSWIWTGNGTSLRGERRPDTTTQDWNGYGEDVAQGEHWAHFPLLEEFLKKQGILDYKDMHNLTIKEWLGNSMWRLDVNNKVMLDRVPNWVLEPTVIPAPLLEDADINNLGIF